MTDIVEPDVFEESDEDEEKTTVYSLHIKFSGYTYATHAGTFTTRDKAIEAAKYHIDMIKRRISGTHILSVSAHDLDEAEPDWCVIWREVVDGPPE